MPESVPSDEDVVKSIAGGDKSALGLLYDRYGRHALGLSVRIVGERAFAEEVVQESFLAVMQKAAMFDVEKASVRSWLLAMVHHKSVDAVRREESMRRRAGTAHRLDAPDEVVDPADAAWDVIVGERVRTALDVLTVEERRAVETAYFGGLTYRETAEMLEQPEGTIKTRMRTALRKLRGALEDEGIVRPWTIAT